MFQRSFQSLIPHIGSFCPVGKVVVAVISVIWHCDYYADRVYELSTTDFSVVRYAASPSAAPAGVGGDAEKIWYCDYGVDIIYELSAVDFSVVRSGISPSAAPYGIGGKG